MLESEDVCRGYFSLIHLDKSSHIRPSAAEEMVKTWEDQGVGGGRPSVAALCYSKTLERMEHIREKLAFSPQLEGPTSHRSCVLQEFHTSPREEHKWDYIQ